MQKAHYPVTDLCNALEVSTSGYYAWSKREKCLRKVEDDSWLDLITSIFKSSRETYGSPRIHATLKELGHKIAEKRVARIMRENGIVVSPVRAWRCITVVSLFIPSPDFLPTPFEDDAYFSLWH